MTWRLPQNPGIGGLDELTSAEETFIQNLAGLSYAQGDILYYNGTVLTRLAAGTSGQFLKTQGAAANPVWAASGGVSGTINEIAYFDSATSIASLAVATYPSLTELSYVKGVTSSIQTQLGTKAPSTAPTFATSITGSYLTASEILITDASKNIVSAPVATYPSLTELTYVKGVTSALQTQLGLKAPLASPTFTGTVTLPSGQALIAPALGTPASGVMTNVTGTASGLTSGNVTTNANLTGHVTSIGNAAVLGAFTLAQLNTAVSDADVASLAGTETLSNKTLTASKLVSGGFIADANGNELLIGVTTASAVNEVTLTNAATAGAPKLAATGGDTNIHLDFDSKGTGVIRPQHAVVNKVVALTDGVNISTDASLGNIFTVTLAGNRTMDNPTNATDGQTFIYKIKQDATGSRTITWGANFRGSTDVALPTLTTTAAYVDYVMFYYNSAVTKWDCLSANKGFAS